jgi:hypothetical protein
MLGRPEMRSHFDLDAYIYGLAVRTVKNVDAFYELKPYMEPIERQCMTTEEKIEDCVETLKKRMFQSNIPDESAKRN